MKTILVCLDTSPRAEKVLATATDFARRSSARLTLFRSVGVPPEIAQEEVIGMAPKTLSERLVASAKQSLLRLSEEVPTELLAAVDVKVGIPWDAICEEAKRVKADLIIVGSHGYGTLDRILGTTAAKVVNHAECSVMVVR